MDQLAFSELSCFISLSSASADPMTQQYTSLLGIDQRKGTRVPLWKHNSIFIILGTSEKITLETTQMFIKARMDKYL